jgi:hypothetical protein
MRNSLAHANSRPSKGTRRPAVFSRYVAAHALALVFLPVSVGIADDRDWVEPRGSNATEVQRLVDDFRASLAIAQPVVVTFAESNPLMVSVQRAGDGRDEFHLSFESGFLDVLTDEDIKAVIAHELGHVWIFTHHPYLQTEALANKIAMRVVSRESLEKVYEKVWQRGGVKGDIARFIH